MTSLGLPTNVRRLCEEHVDSLEKLELLAALDRLGDKQLTRVALAKQLQLSTDIMNQCVDELVRSGLVVLVQDGMVRLNSSDATRAMADLLRLYADDRLMVMRALSDIAMERIRGMAARAFANAFVMRKREDDDDG